MNKQYHVFLTSKASSPLWTSVTECSTFSTIAAGGPFEISCSNFFTVSSSPCTSPCTYDTMSTGLDTFPRDGASRKLYEGGGIFTSPLLKFCTQPVKPYSVAFSFVKYLIASHQLQRTLGVVLTSPSRSFLA